MIHFEATEIVCILHPSAAARNHCKSIFSTNQFGAKAGQGMELNDKLGLLKSVKMHTQRTEGETHRIIMHSSRMRFGAARRCSATYHLHKRMSYSGLLKYNIGFLVQFQNDARLMTFMSQSVCLSGFLILATAAGLVDDEGASERSNIR